MAATRDDWTTALAAAVRLPRAAVRLRRHGLSPVLADVTPSPGAAVDDSMAPRRVGWLVNRVAGFGPYRFNCLKRSVVTLELLARRGHQGELRIGVRDQAGSLDFHAWVEVDGAVVNDNADIATVYSPFDGAFPAGARFSD